MNLTRESWDCMEGSGKPKDQGRSQSRRKKFCPRCGSTDVFFARGLPQLWSIWECRNCGYYGAFIVEDGMMSQKISEEWALKHGQTANRKAQTGMRHQKTNNDQ